MKKDKKRISMRVQTLIAGSILLLAINVVLGLVLMNQSKNAMRTQIEARMFDISNTAADMIDGDVYEKIRLSDKINETESYRGIYDILASFQSNIDLEFIYCIRKLKDGRYAFTIDPALQNSSDYGELAKYTEALEAASKGEPSVDQTPYEDAYGKFYSAYSPIFNSGGEVVGVVAVDFSASWYEEQMSKISGTIVASIAISLLIGALMLWIVTARARERFRKLDREVVELAGDVDSLLGEFAGTSGIQDAGRQPLPEKAGRSEQRLALDRAMHAQNVDAELNVIGERIRSMREVLRGYVDRMRAQANSMITALASDYRSVYYVDLDKDKGICYRAHSKLTDGLEEGEEFAFRETFRNYAQLYVEDDYKEGFLHFIEPEVIRKSLENETIIAYRYLTRRGTQEAYEMLRMAGVRRPEDRDDHIVHAIGIGFSDVDRETRETMAQQQALSDALIVAEEANQVKSAFLSNMSHEIRTPMNAIISLNRMVLETPDISEIVRKHLEKMGQSAQHLLDIINEILDMSRIDSGSLTLVNVPFSFGDLLDLINVDISAQCRKKEIRYVCRIIGEIDDYYIGDAMKLGQILQNVLGNAVKFTESNGMVEFELQKTAGFDGKSTFRFVIRDNGIGMEKSFVPKIFEPFSQEDSTRTNKFGSTGLGMAITRNLVEIMNGNIEVDSKKGVGTSVKITLTFEDAKSALPLTEAGSCAKEHVEAKAELAGRRVLVAEDVDINAEIVLMLLEMREMEADRAENGAVAVELFQKSQEFYYDAILMDIRMPQMDGLEAAAAIRGMERKDAKSIPIIALTANAFDEDMQCSLQAGMDAHLTKPVEPEVLYAELEKRIAP